MSAVGRYSTAGQRLQDTPSLDLSGEVSADEEGEEVEAFVSARWDERWRKWKSRNDKRRHIFPPVKRRSARVPVRTYRHHARLRIHRSPVFDWHREFSHCIASYMTLWMLGAGSIQSSVGASRGTHAFSYVQRFAHSRRESAALRRVYSRAYWGLSSGRRGGDIGSGAA